MRIRDRVVIGVLVGSVLLGWLVWHPVGRWASLGVLVCGVIVAALVYRLRPPAFGLHDDPLRMDELEGAPEVLRLPESEAAAGLAERPAGSDPSSSA
jgi:hypothetical protein